MNVCTIVSRGTFARARVMSATLRDHHPDVSLTVLLLDGDPAEVEGIPGARLVGIESVVGEEWGMLAAGNPPPALSLAVLPYLMRGMLEDGDSAVIYLGPGQRVTGPLTELLALLSQHEVTLVARPAGHTGIVAADDGSQRGAYSHELFGLRRGPSTSAVLADWPRYFTTGGDSGASAVRAWIDGIPARAERVGVLRDPGYGIDAGTLGSRAVDAAGNGTASALIVAGSPARTLDFSDLDPHDPLSWFAGEERVPLTSAPALASLAQHHADDLKAAGFEPRLADERPYRRLDDGLLLTDTLRSLLVDAVLEGSVTRSPFSTEGHGEFYGYLNEPIKRGAPAGLTRLHMTIWDRRLDLRAAYPHIDGPDGEGYAGWLCLHGAEQEGLVPELLPHTPGIAYRDADPQAHLVEPRWGVNVAGFFTSELGVGEAARLLIAALDARRIPALPVQGRLVPPSRQEATFSHAAAPDEAPFPINIICINGDGVPVFAREAGRSFFEGRHTIALWWWEVGAPPKSWQRAYEFVDEVWVASQYIRDAIAPIAPVPVVQITLPVVEPQVAPRTRTQLGLPQDGFLFLYLYDYHSVTGRKNPLGLVEAFCGTFPPGSGAKLVLKSINASSYESEHERVLFAVDEHPDITVLTDYASGGEKNAMIAHCDCYVSLHRSEGFGLTPAEAMLMGKPVIATRYGGNLEFMNDDNACLVDYTLVPVGDGHWPYPADGVWAEPDLEQAGALMRRVFEKPDYARRVGEAARRYMLDRHSPVNAGATMERRLRLIHERLRDAGHHSLNVTQLPPLGGEQPAPREVRDAPTIAWGSGRRARLKWRMHRPVADWVRAYLEHRKELDAGANDAIAETHQLIARLDARLREAAQALQDQQTARHTETQAALRRIESELIDLQRKETRRTGAEGQPADVGARRSLPSSRDAGRSVADESPNVTSQ